MKKYIEPFIEIDDTLDFEDLLQTLTTSEDGGSPGPTPGGPSGGGGGDARGRWGYEEETEADPNGWKDGLW